MRRLIYGKTYIQFICSGCKIAKQCKLEKMSRRDLSAIVVGPVFDQLNGVAFLNPNIFMVCNWIENKVDVYDVNSEYKGVLIDEIIRPVGVIMFPDSYRQLAVLEEMYGIVYVYDIRSAIRDNSDGTVTIIPRTTTHLLFQSEPISFGGSNYFATYFVFGSNFFEVLISMESASIGIQKVERRCVHATRCESGQNSIMVTSSGSVEGAFHAGVASIPSIGEYLVVRRYAFSLRRKFFSI